MSAGDWCVLLGLVFAAFVSGAFTWWILGTGGGSEDEEGGA